jgi:hypothetical protein
LVAGHFDDKGQFMMMITRWFVACGLVLLLASYSLAGEFEKFQLLKVATAEQKAVVKTPNGKLLLVGVGEMVGEATITGIDDGEVRLERPGEFGIETLIVRLDADGKQHIDRMEVRPLRATTLRPGKQE